MLPAVFLIWVTVLFFLGSKFSNLTWSQSGRPNNNNFTQFKAVKNNPDLDLFEVDIKAEKRDMDAPLPKYVPGQLIVKTPDSRFNLDKIDHLNQKYQLRSSRKISPYLYLFEFDGKNLDMEKVAAEYEEQIMIAAASPNYLFAAAVIPNDPQYPDQWHHQSIESEAAWDQQTGSSQTTVAIVDTGVSLNHQDLVNNLDLIQAYDLVDIDTQAYLNAGFELLENEDYVDWDTQPEDINGHGTHVAGIVAAQGNNQVGVSGVSWQTTIIPIRAGFSILWQGQEYGLFELDDLLSALLYVEALAPDIANYSWGSTIYLELMEEFINYIDQANTLQIAAAGNNGSTAPFYPAALSSVISVAALEMNDQRAGWSNYGSWVDYAAPGVDILSTDKNNSYQTMSGTSMASPVVAGIASLVISEHPDYSLELVKYILTQAVSGVDFEPKSGKLLADQAVSLSEEDFIPERITQLKLVKQNQADIFLSWTQVENAQTYRVYRATSPYFSPEAEFLLGETSQSEYLDQGVINNQSSYYYLVTGVNQFDKESLASNLGIAHLYSLQSYSRQNMHYISLPYLYKEAGVTKASDLGFDVFGSSPPLLSAIGRFNAETDTYQALVWFDDYWVGNDWVLETGQSIYIQPPENINFTLVGSHDIEAKLSFTPRLTSQNRDYFSVPFNTTAVSAQDLLNNIYQDNIPEVTVLGRFLPSIDEYQEIMWFEGQFIGSNWLLEPGQGVYIKPQVETEWIPI